MSHKQAKPTLFSFIFNMNHFTGLPRAFSPRNDESLPPSRIWEADVVIHLFDPLVPGFRRDDALGRKFKLKTLTDGAGTLACPQIHQVLF